MDKGHSQPSSPLPPCPPPGRRSPAPGARPPRAMRAGRGGGAGPGAQFSGKECLARRGRLRAPEAVKPGLPSLGLIYCGPKAGLVPPAGLLAGSAVRLTPLRRLLPRLPTPGPSRPPPADPLTTGQSRGGSPRGGARGPAAGARRPRPHPLRRSLPSPPLSSSSPPGPPGPRSLPPPLHNSKACQAGSRLLAPGSAPGKKKKGKEKGKKPAAREREGERGREKGPWSHTAPRAPSPAPTNPAGEPLHPGAEGARATLINYLWANQLFSCPGKGRAG